MEIVEKEADAPMAGRVDTRLDFVADLSEESVT